jgi:DNA-binding transcriptional MocR family regulator
MSSEAVDTPRAALLYEALADRVADKIVTGHLRPGARLWSVRQLARLEGVSPATVVQAYVLLEGRGLIEARPQSGHYVRAPRVPALPEPRSARPVAVPSRVGVADRVARLYRAMRDPHVVPLGTAVVAPELLPTDKLNLILARIARSAGGVGVAYDPPPGSAVLRRAIARRAPSWGMLASPDDVVTTVGCMEAIHLSLRAVVRASDAVAVETPAYYGLLQLLESMELRVFEIPAHPRHGMDLDDLERVVRARAVKAVLAVPSFNNPLGSRMPDEARERLVAMLTAADIPLIEDDIYGDLFHEGDRPRVAKSFDRAGIVLTTGSFSKTLAPGYRVGYVLPGRYKERVEQLKFAHTVACPTLPQLAVAELLDSGGYDHHLRTLRKRLAANVARASEAIATHFPPGTRVSRPQGGFTLWVELPPGVSALDLEARALEHGISVAPGPIFSAKRRFSSNLRIACGAPWSEVIERAIVTLGRLAGQGR